jgi:hypothetical protein
VVQGLTYAFDQVYLEAACADTQRDAKGLMCVRCFACKESVLLIQ